MELSTKRVIGTPLTYQPVMLRELLMSNGEATVEQVAKALLSHDRSQVEYYEIRTKNMVGKVLANNGVVVPVKDGNRIVGYRLKDFVDLDADDRDRLIAECEDKITDYIERRGSSIWQHRFNAKGYVPGSIRYEVLKRAKYRCELCGASAEEVALHVDHIVPRNRGGRDDLSNFQALCITCNTNKRDNDDTDFRGVAHSYGHREAGCIFCEVSADRVIAENELCYAIRDGFPVTPLHTLVIPKRHACDYLNQSPLPVLMPLSSLEYALRRGAARRNPSFGTNVILPYSGLGQQVLRSEQRWPGFGVDARQVRTENELTTVGQIHARAWRPHFAEEPGGLKRKSACDFWNPFGTPATTGIQK